MRKSCLILRRGICALALGLAVAAGAEESTPALEASNWAAVRDETFEAVWKTVNESYFDATFGGVDWAAVGEKYRRQLPQVEDKAALRQLLQAMLAELRKTHFAILPRELAVFTPEERSRMGTVGLTVAWAVDAVAVEEVESDSAAARAGIAPGDVITRIDGFELTQLMGWLERVETNPARRANSLTQLVFNRLHGPVGSPVRLRLRHVAGEERDVELVFAEREGAWTEAVGNLPSVPIRVSSRCEADGLGYLRFSAFAREVMKDFRALLRQLPADGGLVIDLRGNPGGLSLMAAGLSGWLSDRQFSLGTMHLREGRLGFTVFPQSGAFLGPVALLIDSSSASTSEIMAAGLQEAGRVRVFGETSPGAALPSLFKALPSGDLFQHAIADLQTPRGRLIEGQGVVPDETVYRTAADLAARRDPVLAAARQWIYAQRHKLAAASP